MTRGKKQHQGPHLIVQVIQHADQEEGEVEVGVRLQGLGGCRLEVWALKDEGGRHADEHRDEGGVRVDGCAVQILDVAHGPAATQQHLS